MLTRTQAREIVQAELLRRCQIPGDSFVIIDDLTVERPFGWVFFYDSKKYLDSGRVEDAIAGNGPVLVNKNSGHVEFCGSHKPVQSSIRDYEEKLRVSGDAG